MSQQVDMHQDLEMRLPAERTGDLELLSLHRIKNRIHTLVFPEGIHQASPRVLLTRELWAENERYRKEQGHKRYCVTPLGLDTSIASVRGAYEKRAGEKLSGIPDDELVSWLKLGKKDDAAEIRAQFRALAPTEQRRIIIDANLEPVDIKIITVIKKWFVDNYENLIYDTNGNIPYAVVLAMRQKLVRWVMNEGSPFEEPIEDVITEAIVSLGKKPEDYESAEDMWEDMGGKLYKEKD